MEITTRKPGHSRAADVPSNEDIMRRRWEAMGIAFTEAKLQAAARDMDEYDARLAKEKAEAESPEDDIDDAWDQHEEEKQSSATAPHQQSVVSETKDDILWDLGEAFAMPSPEKQRQLEPDPAGKAATRPRRARRVAPARRLPHGGSTGVWIPKDVYEDPRFKSSDEMILYLEVNHLDNEDGCTARNQHFADYLGCNVQTVQDMIRQMTNRGIFACVYPSRTSRIIHIVGGKRSYPRHRN